MTTASLPWMALALPLLGVREIPGPGTSPIIARWLRALRAWWHDDATPWCGVFVAHVLQQAGITLPRHWYRAKGWLEWGKLCQPAYGALCILDRAGGGHVFFVTRISGRYIWGIGGNQGDQVCEAKFDRARAIGFRWPATYPLPQPLIEGADAAGPVSGDER
jgi:uncharacterized protein (TIGR02594 family)